MRMSVLDHGHRRRAKLFLTLTSAMSRVESPDIVKMLLTCRAESAALALR